MLGHMCAGAGDGEHALTQSLGAGNRAAFHQIGDDGQVGAGLGGAFVHRAHALTDFQTDVPQQRQKTLDGIAENFMVGAVQQDQQIDIGIGMQFAAAVAADCQQGDVGVFAPVELLPGLLQDVVDEPGAVFDQSADVPARLRSGRRATSRGLADGLLEGGYGAAPSVPARPGTGRDRTDLGPPAASNWLSFYLYRPC